MRLTRLQMAITVAALALFGVYWAVRAQESPPVFAPPAVLPPAPPAKSAKTKAQADPSLIIPAEVYEAPRPLGPLAAPPLPPLEKPPELIQAGGEMPAPMFPPAPAAAPIPAPAPGVVVPEPAPLLDGKPLIAPPVHEPTKVLLIDPSAREAPKEPALPTPPVIDPPTHAVKQALPMPPPVIVPPMEKGTEAPPPAPDPPATERVKSFVRIQRAENGAPPEMMPVAGGAIIPVANINRQSELPGPSRDALVNLQTPTIAVEKRGPNSLRAGETQLFHLVIHNYGTIAAQQIRIEDDIPADVRLLAAEPMPQMQGARAVWTLSALAAGSEQSLRMTLKADANVQLAARTTVLVSSGSVTTRTKSAPASLPVRMNGPARVGVGKPAVFEIQVQNTTAQPLTEIVLFGDLPDGLVAQVTDESGHRREERQIEGKMDGISVAPGDAKILRMPTTAVKPGHYTVQARVVTAAGEGSATAQIDIAVETPFVQQAPSTRLVPGRDGDLRIELANNTPNDMRNVTVADLLPEGFFFLGASDRGLYQAHRRTVHWLLDKLPAGATKTLFVRVNSDKMGQFQNVASARADGVAEVRCAGILIVEGLADLSLRVLDRDNPIEVGRETAYEIQVQNPGNAPARNVRLQAQFPPGLIPKNAQSNAPFSIDRDRIVFEPIAFLAPHEQAIFRVSAAAQTAGKDQRVRFSVASDEVPRPIQREITVLVYSGK